MSELRWRLWRLAFAPDLRRTSEWSFRANEAFMRLIKSVFIALALRSWK